MKYGVTKQVVSFEEREVADGVILFKRDRSCQWQARLRRVTGKWLSLSTKSDDIEVAKEYALSRYKDMKDAQARGEIDISRKFSDVAKLTIKELQAELDTGVGRHANRDYILAIKRWLIPALGRYPVYGITHQHLVQLDNYRTTSLKRRASGSTINTHNAALKRVFRVAVQRGFMVPVQIPALFNHGKKAKCRPYFDRKDSALILEKIDAFSRTGHKESSKELRELLADYVTILYNTGMRPGVESLELKWNQIKRIKVEEVDQTEKVGDQHSTLTFAVVGKKRARKLVCREAEGNVSLRLMAIQNRFEELKGLKEDELFKKDEYVFRLRSGAVPDPQRLTKAFKIFLKSIEIEKDEHGDVRTLYSIRHTYATTGLVKNMTMETLAAQMGTSRPMIERYYSKLSPEMKARELSGWDEQSQKKAKAATASEMDQVVKLLTEQNQMLMRKLEELVSTR